MNILSHECAPSRKKQKIVCPSPLGHETFVECGTPLRISSKLQYFSKIGRCSVCESRFKAINLWFN